MRRPRVAIAIALALCVRGAFGSADGNAEVCVYAPPRFISRDARETDSSALLRAYAPVFIAGPCENPDNQIGSPAIRVARFGKQAAVDPGVPAIFAEVRRDRLGGIDILQLVYRVHFRAQPAPFYEVHRNPGILAIVTLRARDQQPILFTTVHTCGCFLAVLPTDLFPREALPAAWPSDKLRVSGKVLPSMVRHPVPGRTRLIVWLGDKTHRVEDIATLAVLPAGRRITVPLVPMAALHRLPIAGGATESFFYTRGPFKGYVRGAWSPVEGLTAGLLLLDPWLGSDKDFGDPAVTGTRLYTSLLPWKREVSRLDRFDPLLRSMNFRLDRSFGPTQ